MKLVIVSHTAHYRDGRGFVGWGPTVREIDQLASLFEQVVHVAPLHPGPAPASATKYQSPRVAIRPVSPSGGDRRIDKLGILARSPQYIRTLLNAFREADVAHVRCPANISLIAILLLAAVRTPSLRWAKYAGSWQPDGVEPSSYRFQRWWLKRGFHRGVVTINGQWPDQPPHVHAFLNPCLTEEELDEARQLASGKQLTAPVRLLYVGRLEHAKGVDRVLRTLARLQEQGISTTLDLVGDGSQRAEYERLAAALGISPQVRFHSWLPRSALAPLYVQSHIVLLPSSTEGWPKVLSEAMAYGAVPVASNVGSIPHYLRQFGLGRTYDPADVEGFTDAIVRYVSHPGEWGEESQRGIRAGELFSYTRYLKAVQSILGLTPCTLRC